MISDASLPANLVPTAMDVLLKLSSGERDFMRVIVEVVQNVREDANAPNIRDSARPDEQDEDEDDEDQLDLATATAEDIAEDQRKRLEKAAKKMQNQQLNPEKKDTYLRCLDLVRALLERVAGVSLSPAPQVRKNDLF
jgi:condensin complex subunit 3